MKLKANRMLLLAVLLLAASFGAHAYSCTVSSPGFVSVYDALAATANLNQSAFTLNCTRASGEASTLNYQANTDDGLYNNGANNRAKLPTAANTFIKYDFFTTSGLSTNWSKGNKCIFGQINFGASLSASQTKTYYSSIPAAQTGLAQGAYFDTVTINVAYLGAQTSCQNNATISASGTFPVQISNVPGCQLLPLPPPSVDFTYTAFQNTAAIAAPSAFSARCSTNLPYTMTLDSSIGVVSGLNYSLSITNRLSTAVVTGGSGNGAQQDFYIRGSMPGGQAGTCATATCNASDSRVLTISY